MPGLTALCGQQGGKVTNEWLLLFRLWQLE